MTLAGLVMVIIWVGVTAYTIFGGADFGAGVWDLVAGSAHRGEHRRALLERSIGPVWEANHVWLIFVLVYMWTAFPTVFVSIMTTLYIPFMLAGIGIVLRGSAFAFRKWAPTIAGKRALGAAFAGSSLLTPFFLGTIAGGVASGRVPLGNAVGDPWTSWLNPTSILGGVLAVVVASYIAAVLVARDAQRSGLTELYSYFRTRSLVAGVAAGIVALFGVYVIETDAPILAEELTSSYGVVIVVLSAVAGAASLVAIQRSLTRLARILAVLATVAILWGWAVAQYPWLLPDVITIDEAAASDAVLIALFIAFAAAAIIAVPSLIWLLSLTDRGVLDADRPVRDGSSDAVLSELVSDVEGRP